MSRPRPTPDVRAIVAEVLQIPEPDVLPGADLRTLPGIDSVKILRIVTRIEQKHGIELDEDVVFKLATCEHLADLVQRTVQRKSEAACG